MDNNNKRHIVKSVSWRIIASLTTVLVSYGFTGSISIGLGIGAIEFFLKLALYYAHERFWFKNIRFK